MLTYPEIDPVAIAIGPVAIRWYGLSYVAGIGIGWWLGRRRAARDPWRGWTPQQVDDLAFWFVVGAVAGGRAGYLLFYDFSGLVSDPLTVFRIWEGGMSFHGGLIGVLAAGAWFARRQGRGFFAVSDFLAPLVPPGLGAGRIANFVNGELWGKPSDAPWAMIFPGAGPAPRHPSQLYEAVLEGLLLFAMLTAAAHTRRLAARPGTLAGIFFAGYGIARIVAELFREPDAFLGFVVSGITMGQVLSIPMLLLGLYLVWRPMSGPLRPRAGR